MTITELEEVLPSSEITKYYWHNKPQLERLRDDDAVVIMGHYSQYNSALDRSPSRGLLEETTTLTNLVISLLAKEYIRQYLFIRHATGLQYRKVKKLESAKTGYRECCVIVTSEVTQCLLLARILLGLREERV